MTKLDNVDQPYLVDQPQEGLYVAAFFSEQTTYLISDYLERNHIPNPVAESSLHTTIVYSKVPVRDFEAVHTLDIAVNTQYRKGERRSPFLRLVKYHHMFPLIYHDRSKNCLKLSREDLKLMAEACSSNPALKDAMETAKLIWLLTDPVRRRDADCYPVNYKTIDE
jgi:hypothetical protein